MPLERKQLDTSSLQAKFLPKELRSLNVGVPYWVAVEAFNESGVSKLSRVVPIR